MGGLLFSLFVLGGGVLGLALYFLPSIVANRNRHPSAVGIFVLNLLLGWSLIGWIVSLVWAFSKPQPVVIVQNAPAYLPPNYPQHPQASQPYPQQYAQTIPAYPQSPQPNPQSTQAYAQQPAFPPQSANDPQI